MGIWIEIHCDKQAPIADGCGRNKCVSGSGNQPGAMTLRKPATVARGLISDALKAGWVREGDKMICPQCAEYWRKASNTSFSPKSLSADS